MPRRVTTRDVGEVLLFAAFLLALSGCLPQASKDVEKAQDSVPGSSIHHVPVEITGSDVIDVAGLTIQVAMIVITVATLLGAVAAFIGVREFREVQRTQSAMKAEIVEAGVLRARIQGEVERIEEQFETLVQAAHLFNEGQNLYRRNEYEKAITWFKEALELHPMNVRIMVRIARSYTNQGRLKESEHYLRRALKVDPSHPELMRAHATNLRYVDPPSALRAAAEAVDLDLADYESWNYLGLLYRDQGDLESALFAYEQASDLRPTDPIGTFYRACVLWRQDKRDEARWRVSQASSLVTSAEKIDKIKPMWAATVKWAEMYMDSSTSRTKLADHTSKLLSLAGETRNRQTIVSHMLFICYGPERKNIRNSGWVGKLSRAERNRFKKGLG